jgi:tRNA A-37 threonylcarbamoyl transferase component Bud32
LKRLTEQEYLAMRAGAKVLEVDHCGDKVLKLADGTIFKMFRRKRLISSAALYPYAQRFANNADALARLGIPVPKVISVVRIQAIARDAVHYEPLAGTTLRELVRAGLAAEQKRALKEAFTRFVIYLHDKGVYFRSLHIGNVVYTPEGRLGLIDFSDLRIQPWPLGSYLRARNLRRMQGIADELDWLDIDAIVRARPPDAGVPT